MKIAWFTPFSNRSAIGKVSKKICESLSNKVDVVIYAPDTEDIIDTNIEVRHIDKTIIKKGVVGFDYCIYNLGNYYAFHGSIVEVLKRTPGIVLFHDQTMLDFWIAYFYEHEGAKAFKKFSEFLYRYEGVTDHDECMAAFQGKRRSEYPLLKPFLHNAMGVFTHSSKFCDSLKSIYNGKIDYAYLPCDELGIIDADEEIKRMIDDAHRQGKLVCVSNGLVQETKLIDAVQKVLLDHSNLQEKILYLVIGSYDGEYGENVAKIANEKLSGCMKMLGYQTYGNMNYALKHSDFCFNLRYPNSEACSLSLLEQMKCGKAVVALDSGIYGEVPENSVKRVKRESLFEDLYNFLNDDVDKIKLENIGNNAKLFVDENCNEIQYISSIMKFIEGLEKAYRIAQVEDQLLKKVSKNIVRMGIGADNQEVGNIANIVAGIFDLGE